MSNLTSNAEVTALVKSAVSLSSADLTALIERVEAEITAVIGAPYVDAETTISETLHGEGKDLFLARRVGSVDSVTEYETPVSDGVVLTADDYYAWLEEGRLERISTLEWAARVDVAYVPKDERSKRKQAVIDLVRLYIERTANFQESVGGEFSFTAPANWEREKRRVMRRLSFVAV